MRMTRNDIQADIYTMIETPDSSGYMVKTLVKIYTIDIDIQPIGRKVDFTAYGLESVGAGAMRGFCDADLLSIGDVISAKEKTYIVKGLKDWEDDQETIIEPFAVEL